MWTEPEPEPGRGFNAGAKQGSWNPARFFFFERSKAWQLPPRPQG